MSYTTRIKNEIITIEESKSELIALLSAFIRNNGYLEDGALFLTTENDNTKNKIINSFKRLYEVDALVEVKNNLNFSKKDLYLIKLNKNVDFIFESEVSPLKIDIPSIIKNAATQAARTNNIEIKVIIHI